MEMLAKGKQKKKPGTVAENRQAKFNYQIDEKFECGIVLVGTEVKSCRAGKCNIQEGYVRVDRDGQLKLFNCNIAQHDHTGNVFNHEERRPRVLLAHRAEISQILKKQEQRGGTCVPLRVYFNDIGFLKCEIATCRCPPPSAFCPLPSALNQNRRAWRRAVCICVCARACNIRLA